ncbi:MAG: PLP-dependent transferase [Deltaproteobacteria bacterium]|nr:PLP-dependent transferase [Deltaproteobacteria bacterium]
MQTIAVHAGRLEPAPEGAVATPIFQTSTYHDARAEDGSYDDVRYTRLNNGPNHLALAERLAALAGTESALVTASGMAAITTTILAHVRAGERVLFQRGLYGGTHMLAGDLARWGIGVDVADGDDPAAWRGMIRPGTRLVLVEAISNPLVKIIDLSAVVALGRAHHLVTMIDATFASPANLRPAELGFDLEVHSATKYLNGHSDIIAGAVMGRRDHVARVARLLGHTGACLDPHACFLLERGLKTLPLRVRQQNANALALARFFASRLADDVRAVHYPGLDPERLVPAAVRDAFGGFGGVLAVELASAELAERALAHLALAIHAPSLGGVETLVTRPTTTSHRGLTPAERQAAGIVDGLVRIACGIEDADDLAQDFAQALARAHASA